MQCAVPPNQHLEYGSGLIAAARNFSSSRPTQHYSHFAFDRYADIVKDLSNLHPISKWLYDNRSKWNFMEREIFDHHQQGVTSNHNQLRGNYSAREVDSSLPIDHHQHSDSDMAGLNDSEDDEDEDSRYGDLGEPYRDAPGQIIVEGAGNPSVNGIYHPDGHFEGAHKYTMRGKYKGSPATFSLFQCNVSNNTKHWYISIVPRNSQPGTSTDIDFYSAPAQENCLEFPPLDSWAKSNGELKNGNVFRPLSSCIVMI